MAAYGHFRRRDRCGLNMSFLSDPSAAGFFCVSTSYRQEPNPILGRHELIFPMFEFECPGDVQTLEALLKDLVVELGLSARDGILSQNYADWCSFYDTSELSYAEEADMGARYPDQVCLIKNFPNTTSPFWNMRQNGDGTAAKIDVILAGQETIGSAERSCDPLEMCHMFNTISGGAYANILFETFGKDRVEMELDAFLKLNFFPRVGGGIGLTSHPRP